MIPKIIHYCWFGKKPLPDLAKKCIESWKKYLPDYEIKEWNESNFDLCCCEYVKEAYDAEKWAFVSDYARFWILYNYGGIYFDTDVEVIKDMSDIIGNGAFMGCETVDKCAPGLGLGANPRLGLYKEIIDYYNHIHFTCENDHVPTVVDHMTSILKKHGWVGKNEISVIGDITIYPPEYFCPMNYVTGEITITEHTVSIHHYLATWLSPHKNRWILFRRFLAQKLGKEKYMKMSKTTIWRAIDGIQVRGIKSVVINFFDKYIKKNKEQM